MQVLLDLADPIRSRGMLLRVLLVAGVADQALQLIEKPHRAPRTSGSDRAPRSSARLLNERFLVHSAHGGRNLLFSSAHRLRMRGTEWDRYPQREREGCALADGGVGPDPSAVPLDHPLHRR
jgi:hypothetical protein